MKIKKQEFIVDKWGLYLTPLIGYSKAPKDERSFWVGWLWFLYRIYF